LAFMAARRKRTSDVEIASNRETQHESVDDCGGSHAGEDIVQALTKYLGSTEGVGGSLIDTNEYEDDDVALVEKESDELLVLVQLIQTNLQQLAPLVEPLHQMLSEEQFKTDEGISFLDAKNQILLSYMTQMSYYILLKSLGVPVRNHPIVERLVELRLIFEKMRPVESKLKHQIDKLLQIASSPQKSDAPRGPNPERIVTKENDEDEIGATSEVYRPPKVAAVEYTGDKIPPTERAAKEKERQRRRLAKSEVVRMMREDLMETPEVLGTVEKLNVKGSYLLKLQAEREQYEEENMVRLQVRKKEKKDVAKLKKRSGEFSGGSTLSQLINFAEQAMNDIEQ